MQEILQGSGSEYSITVQAFQSSEPCAWCALHKESSGCPDCIYRRKWEQNRERRGKRETDFSQ